VLGYADWIVGAVAIMLGLVLCYSAAASRPQMYDLPKIRWLESRMGRRATQAIIVLLGVLLVAVGVAVALGWKMNWQQRRTTVEPPTTDRCSA